MPLSLQISARDRIGIFGKTGSGKTYFTINKLVPLFRRVFIWNPKRESYGERNQFVSLDALTNAQLSMSDIVLSVYPRGLVGNADMGAEFACFARVMTAVRNCLMVVEEPGLFRANKVGRNALMAIVTQGRTWNMPVVICAQRAVMIHPDSRSQFSKLVSFRQSMPEDLKALESWGMDTNGLAQFKRGEYRLWLDDA